MKPIERRDCLKLLASGAAIASVPVLTGGCASVGDLLRGGSAGPGHFEALGVDRDMLGRVMSRGLSRGGDFCEVFLQHRIKHSLEMEDGRISRAFTAVDLGAGVRVLKGDSTGYAYCEDLSEKSLQSAAATAAAVADGPARVQVAPLAAVTVPNRYLVERPWSEVGVNKKLPIVTRADDRTRAADARVTRVTVGLLDEACWIMLADSEGRQVEDVQPMTVLKVSCTAVQGSATETSFRSAASRDGIEFYTPDLIDKVGAEAAQYTVMLFDASPPPAGAYPVVLAPGYTGILLHEAIGHGMEADFNRKRISIYTDRIGEGVAPRDVTIVDDGTNPRMRGSINIDDEGAPGQRTVLVEDGILRSYMHDRISASHFKVDRTGSGRRESFRYPPNPRMRNTYMMAGPRDPAEIIASVNKGIYAEYFMNGQVSIGVGDFAFYLKHGRMIENGKLTRIIKDANLVGNGPKVLETIDMVGSDLVFYDGSSTCGKDGQWVPVGFGMPTVRAGAISIGGRKS